MARSHADAVTPQGYIGRRSTYSGGEITPKGYRRVWSAEHGRLKMEHVLVWERFNGPVPDGYQIHHLDGEKLNNDIRNLTIVTPLEHKRIHGGCELRTDGWWKPCTNCKEVKHERDYYRLNKGRWIQSICKPCQIASSIATKQRRRQRV